MGTLLGLAVWLLVFVGMALSQSRTESRVDVFDRNYNRTGHVIMNRETGRLDSYDTKSNHISTSTLTPPPALVRPGRRADSPNKHRAF